MRCWRVTISATAQATVVLGGDGPGEEPFYSEIMGDHEYLPNGNILLALSGTFGCLIGGVLDDRFGSKLVIMGSLSLLLLSLAALCLLAGILPGYFIDALAPVSSVSIEQIQGLWQLQRRIVIKRGWLHWLSSTRYQTRR